VNKKSKKTLIPVGFGYVLAQAGKNQKFFASFFQKRSAFLRSKRPARFTRPDTNG
jgi:hypothetical protein